MKRLLLLCCLALLAAPLTLLAQVANNTSLVGTVSDATGGVIAGAHVVGVNRDTKVTYSGDTNGEGYYSIPFVAPGTYNVTVEKSGFQKITTAGVAVQLNMAVRTDFSLSVGTDTTEITVSASTPALSTDDALIGDTIGTHQVTNLPMNTRRVMDLATTASNVIIGPKTSFRDVPPGANYIGAGTREVTNSLTLDGITIMNSLISNSPVTPNPDAISAVQVQSGNYTAQYGAYMGIHINSDTKSGTNTLHGTAYDYVQNDVFNAKPWLAAKGAKAAKMRFNQFGGVLSGPVVIPFLYNGRDKTFFMGSYEGLRQYQQTSTVGAVPTVKMRSGDFSELLDPNLMCSPSDTSEQCKQKLVQLYDPANRTTQYANNQIPVDPIAAKLLQYYPLPTQSGLGNNFNSYAPLNLLQNQTLDRVDHNIGQNVRLFGRFLWQKLDYVSGSAIPTSNAYSPTTDRNGMIGYTHIITPNFINDLRVGFNVLTNSVNNGFAQAGQKDAGSKLGIPGYTADVDNNNPGIPTINVTNYFTLGSGGTNWKQDDRTLHAYDQISWTKGKHTIMAGADIRRMTIGRAAQNDPRGSFTFNGRYTSFCQPVPGSNPSACDNKTSSNGMADFIIGRASAAVTPTFQVKGSVGSWRNGYFVQDNWQVTQKLTLLYGIRYEQPTIPYSLNGYARILNADFTALIPATNATTGNTFTPTPGFKFTGSNNNLWAPRLGFAYRATDKIVIRGGGGIYYNPNHLNAFTLASSNYPLANAATYNANPNLSVNTFENPSGGAAAKSGCVPTDFQSYCNAFTDAPRLPTPRMYQWNVDTGVELWKDAAFELQYLGSKSVNLDFSWQPNTPQPGSGVINSRRPYQNFGVIREIYNGGWSTYNGLTAILRQRMSRGLSMNMSYTWAHNMDTSNDANGSGYLMNPYNIHADYGNSNWDIRHRFVGTVLYQLPEFSGRNYAVRTVLGGWQANMIVTLQTGMPFNVGLASDIANTGTSGVQRPNFVNAGSNTCTNDFLVRNRSVSCVDRTAYALPANYTYGNLHRNDQHGPGRELVNFSMFKNFPLYERLTLQLRAEAFNLFNHANPSNPIVTGYTGPNVAGTFGTVTSTQTDPRVLQLAGKINF
ncbi:TonB-dependent receptor [Edaphobacter albus]|uniref:TonB-dependent receptor n=1 Tax=Edaphobacter sp. 4G125 TaxID=2763071 RepID=UPI001645970C|nr:TonB-dependent receptor [Edaphobacter sp. 4G125]QNI35616.1 TonB-dependent receptor [Edaphobacter sp. 4G125]